MSEHDEEQGMSPIDRLNALEDSIKSVREMNAEANATIEAALEAAIKRLEESLSALDDEGPPQEIAAAMVQVEGNVLRLDRDEKNLHGQYNYASVDAFYEMVGKLCADAKIVIKPRQVGDPERATLKRQSGKEETVLLYKFVFQWIHESGRSWLDRHDAQIVPMPYNGAQTAGQARSYAHKYYLRATFQIPTGDPDPEQVMPGRDDFYNPINAPAARSQRAPSKSSKPPATSKPAAETGPSLQFFMAGGQPEMIPVSGVVTAIRKLLDGKSIDAKGRWMATNTIAMTELSTLDKKRWLDIKRIVESSPDDQHEGGML